jgi:hypothetical protein
LAVHLHELTEAVFQSQVKSLISELDVFCIRNKELIQIQFYLHVILANRAMYQYSNYYNISRDTKIINQLHSAIFLTKNKNIFRLVDDITLEYYKIFNNLILDTQISNQIKLYYYQISAEKLTQKSTLINYTPIIQSKISYPLIYENANKKHSIFFTPFIKFMSATNISDSQQLELIDTKALLPLTKHNFLSPNYYSGLDYTEDAMKIAYGIDLNLNKKNNRRLLDFFLGKVIYLNGFSTYNHDMISGISYFLRDYIEIYYYGHFGSKKFLTYRDDFGVKINTKKIRFSIRGININEIKKQYFVNLNSLDIKDQLSQFNIDISHDLSENWSVSYSNILSFKDENFDLREGLLQNSYQITYKNECTLISLGLVQNFTSDSSRNITNLNQYSINIGLKTLNL